MAAHSDSAAAKESLAHWGWESVPAPAQFGYDGSIRRSRIAQYQRLSPQDACVCFAKHGQSRFFEKSRAPRDVSSHSLSHFPVL